MSAPILNPPVFPELRIEGQGRIAELALGRPALMAILVVLALALFTACGQAVESVGGRLHLGRCPPASGHDIIGHGLRTAPDLVAFTLALGASGRDLRIATGLAEIAFDVVGRGLQTATTRVDSVRDPLLVEEVVVTVHGHSISLSTLVTARGHVRGFLPPLTALNQRR